MGQKVWYAPISMLPERAECCLLNWARGALANDKNPGCVAGGREGLGRSRDRLSTKVHLIADRRCRPLIRITTPGQHGDCPKFIPPMGQLAIRRRGKGRPRTRAAAAMGDKAYSSAANRVYLRRRGSKAVIPVKEDQKNHRLNRGSRGGRPRELDRQLYKNRNSVERYFGKLTQFRAIATRYDKRELIYQGTVDVGSTRIWLRDSGP